MIDLDRIGRIISKRFEGHFPLKFFCACRALLGHLEVTESDVNSVDPSNRDNLISACFGLGISLDLRVVRTYLSSQLVMPSLHKGIEHAIQHPNASLRHFRDTSVPSDVRTKYADPILRAFSFGHFDISDEYVLLALMRSASVSVLQSPSVIYQLYVHYHIEIVKGFMKRCDLKSKDEMGRNVLHLSARDGNMEAFCWFINNGADISALDTNGWSPLAYAVRGGHHSVVSLFLSMNSPVDLIDQSGNTLLHLASMSGSMEVLKVISSSDNLEKNKESMKKRISQWNNDRENCIDIAIGQCDWRIVEWYLSSFFDLNVVSVAGADSLVAQHSPVAPTFASSTGMMLLHSVVFNRRMDILKLMRLQNQRTELLPAFKLAVNLGYTEIVEELLNKDRDILTLVSGSKHPLIVAVITGNTSLVRILLHHSELFAFDVLVNCFLASFASQTMEIENNISEILRIRPHTLSSMTPILSLIFNNKESVREMLKGADCSELLGLVVECGISVDRLFANEEKTLLVNATEKGHTQIMKYLTYGEMQSGLGHHKTTLTPAYEAVPTAHDASLLDVPDEMITSDDAHLKSHSVLNGRVFDGGCCVSLMLASKSGHSQCIEMLLNNDASVNESDIDGMTSLMFASENGHTACVEFLLKSGAEVNAADADGLTSLMLASENGHLSCVNMLIGGGADVNASWNDGSTSLMIASENGHIACVESLLIHGANVNTSWHDGSTSLMFASREGRSSCVEVLLKHGGDVNAADTDGSTSLMIASQNGHSSTVELLLANGANENATWQDGTTSLMFAAENGHISCVELLLKYGADVNAADTDGLTSLMLSSQNGHVSCMELLLNSGADVNASRHDGWTSLMFAAENGHSSCVALLLNRGADVNASENRGMTSLILASQNGYTNCIEKLRKAGAVYWC